MTIRNTAKNDVHPEWLFGRNPRAIEAQEAQGQKELVASSMLPTQITSEARSRLESGGVTFGEILPNDPLFRTVHFPDGWILRPHIDHSMWTDLIDNTGTVQAQIFYKAAFYDRHAFVE